MLRLYILLRDIFSNSIAFTVINKYGKGGAVGISTIFAPLTCCFLKGPLKGDFLEICLTTFLRVRNWRNTSDVRVIFFFCKCWKFTIAFTNAAKNWENVFSFWDKWIWIGYLKFSLLRRILLIGSQCVKKQS